MGGVYGDFNTLRWDRLFISAFGPFNLAAFVALPIAIGVFAIVSPLFAALYEFSQLLGNIGEIVTFLFLVFLIFRQIRSLSMYFSDKVPQALESFVGTYIYVQVFLIASAFIVYLLWVIRSDDNVYEPCLAWIVGFISFSEYIILRINEFGSIDRNDPLQIQHYLKTFAVHGLFALIGFIAIVLWVKDPSATVYEPTASLFGLASLVWLYLAQGSQGVVSRLLRTFIPRKN